MVLIVGIIVVFAVVNSASLSALLLMALRGFADPSWKKLIYVFPSVATLAVILWGIYTIAISYSQPADPNIGLGIVIVFGLPFCVASLILSGFTHYLLAKTRNN